MKLFLPKFEEKKFRKVINSDEDFHLLKNRFLRINDAETGKMTVSGINQRNYKSFKHVK